MRDDAVLRRALPLGRGLGRYTHALIHWKLIVESGNFMHHGIWIDRTGAKYYTVSQNNTSLAIDYTVSQKNNPLCNHSGNQTWTAWVRVTDYTVSQKNTPL